MPQEFLHACTFLHDDAKEAADLALLYWGLQARVVWAMDPTSCSCCS